MAGGALAALEELGQGVPQLRQLEDLAVQQLEQRAQALVKGVPLLLAALQTPLQLPQLGLQRLVPRLRVLKQRPGHGAQSRGEPSLPAHGRVSLTCSLSESESFCVWNSLALSTSALSLCNS